MDDQLPRPTRKCDTLWHLLLLEHPREFVFLATLVLALIARMSAFSLGYSVDDYMYLSDDRELAITNRSLLLSQGRPGMVLLVEILRWLGLNVSRDYVIGTALLTVSLVWLAFTSIKLAGLSERVRLAAGAASMIVLYPYQAEYFTFRVALLLVAVPTAMTAFALSGNRPSARRIALSALLLLAGTAIWQEALVLFGAASLFAFSCRFACSEEPGIRVRTLAASRKSNLMANLISALAALLLYLPLLWIMARTWGLKLSDRTQFVGIADIQLRIRQIFGLIVNLLLASEPVIPRGPKLLILALFFVSGLIALIRGLQGTKRDGWRSILVSGMALPAVLLGSAMAAVIPLHTWWPAPRSLIAVSWLWAYLAVCSLLWLDRYAGKKAVGAGAVLVAVAVFAMVGLNNQVLTDQLRLNIRDREQMNRIIGRLETTPGFSKVSRLMIVGGEWGYAVPITTVQGDLNTSAFFPEWSKVALAREISGYNFQPVDAQDEVARFRSACSASEKWPNVESLHVAGEAAFVCLPRTH